jgi:hypothetical protein
MGRKTTKALGAAVAIASGSALSMPAMAQQPIPRAASYADLFEQVPDAQLRLAQDDHVRMERASGLNGAQLADNDDHHHHDHHHHHHHHAHDRQWYRSHGYYWSGGAWRLRDADRHHHHHHHHHHNHDHY